MKWLRRLFAPAVRPCPASPRRMRPTLEALEDRQVPTVTYYGGAVLPNVEAQALYIGDQWSANPALFSQA